MENPLSSDSDSTTDSHNWSSDIEEQIQMIEENCKNMNFGEIYKILYKNRK